MPSAGASTRSSIFIASTTKRRSPRRTFWSAFVCAAMTTPGIGAATSEPIVSSTFRGRIDVSSSYVSPCRATQHVVPSRAAAAG